MIDASRIKKRIRRAKKNVRQLDKLLVHVIIVLTPLNRKNLFPAISKRKVQTLSINHHLKKGKRREYVDFYVNYRKNPKLDEHMRKYFPNLVTQPQNPALILAKVVGRTSLIQIGSSMLLP